MISHKNIETAVRAAAVKSAMGRNSFNSAQPRPSCSDSPDKVTINSTSDNLQQKYFS
jgi:hypothetical protein